MIIVCPECATRYTVKPESFEPDGRKVRCTQCSHTWSQRPLGETEVIDVSIAPLDQVKTAAAVTKPRDIESEAARLLRASRQTAERLRDQAALRRGTLVGWAYLSVAASIVLTAAVVFRHPIVRTAPTLATLYETVGLEVNVRGMVFRKVVYERQYENGLPVLAIKGEIVNISGEPKIVPKIRFGLRDQTRQELYHWSMQVQKEPLGPDQSTAFVARLASPPTDANDIQVRFARRSETGVMF